MIVNNGYKREAFLRKISLHLTGDARFGTDGSGVVYFGAGFWRGMWVDDLSIRLVNPGVPNRDIAVVEEALCVLLCGAYKAA